MGAWDRCEPIAIAAPIDGGTEVHLTLAVPPAASDRFV